MTNKKERESVGIVITPNFSDKYIIKSKKKFREELEEHFNIPLNIEILIETSLKDYTDISKVFDELADLREENQWEYTFFITDLLIKGDEITAIEYNDETNTAMLSLPIFFGWNFKSKIIDFIKEMINHFNEPEKYPISEIDKMSEFIEKDSESKLIVKDNLSSRMKLILGMSILNHPIAILNNLAGIIAIAFSTGSFGLVFSTMWVLALNFTPLRLSAITVVGIASMMIWIISVHNLWTRGASNKGLRRIYNGATTLTLFVSISMFFLSLFTLFLIATILLLPKDFLYEQLDIPLSHSKFIYVKIAWFAANISTFAGAIGAGFESRSQLKDIMFQLPFREKTEEKTE